MSKTQNTKNTTLYSTLLPRLTSLSHKKPAKNTRFSPTESLQAPACRPPAARLFSRSLSEHIFRKQAPAREIPPPARCPPVLNWELEFFPETPQAPARDEDYPAGRSPVLFTHLGSFQIHPGDRLPFPSPPAVPARVFLATFCPPLEV